MWSTPGRPIGQGTFCTWHPNAHAADAEWHELLPLASCPNLWWVPHPTTSWLNQAPLRIVGEWGSGFVHLTKLQQGPPFLSDKHLMFANNFWMPKCRKEFRRLVVDGCGRNVIWFWRIEWLDFWDNFCRNISWMENFGDFPDSLKDWCFLFKLLLCIYVYMVWSWNNVYTTYSHTVSYLMTSLIYWSCIKCIFKQLYRLGGHLFTRNNGQSDSTLDETVTPWQNDVIRNKICNKHPNPEYLPDKNPSWLPKATSTSYGFQKMIMLIFSLL